MYVVLTRKPSAANARGDRGVRALRLRSDFFLRRDDAESYARVLREREGVGAWIAHIIDDKEDTP